MSELKLIPAIPELPSEIYKAHLNKKLAIFVGAGVSRLVGCKGWDELASDLLITCKEKGLINYYEEERIKGFSDNKKKITIAKELLIKKYSDEFYKCFESSIKVTQNNNIILDIIKLGNIFITTNADDSFKDIDVHPKKDGNYESIEPEIDHLYHIHGHKDIRDSLVFTVSEYLRRYNDKNFIKFLDSVFDNYTVLFIGYGLSS